jgi:hypothetical protein
MGKGKKREELCERGSDYSPPVAHSSQVRLRQSAAATRWC